MYDDPEWSYSYCIGINLRMIILTRVHSRKSVLKQVSVYACTFMGVYIMCIRTHTYTHIGLHTYTHTNIHTYTHTHIHTYTHTHIHTNTHTHTNIYIYIYIYLYIH